MKEGIGGSKTRRERIERIYEGVENARKRDRNRKKTKKKRKEEVKKHGR